MARQRRDAVLAKVLDRRGGVSFRDLQSLLKRLGFSHERTRGSHLIYTHPRVFRPLSIQAKGNEAKRYQLDQLRDIISEFHLLDE
ncbi:type II toxin-antitoxin system HicA family toxin [Bauldia litoralis]|uniref:type II toxin-antitoxin system HicA family toxin n=1 Tax=Bauldia litoralis TaxID=665467 RepID=UPI003D6598DA